MNDFLPCSQHTCVHRDIRLCVDMVLAYLATTNSNVGDTMNVHSHVCSMVVHAVILFIARTVKEVLSTSYYSEMYRFLTSLDKECADAANQDIINAMMSADPISVS